MLPDPDESTEEETEPENYLPISYNTITEAFAQRAAKVLNETEETRVKCLKELRDKLREIEDLDYNDTDDFLLCFLRSRKFNSGRAAAAIKYYYRFLGEYRHLFDKVDNQVISLVVQSNIVGFLPYRDAKGCGIVYLRAEAWNTDELPTDDAVCGGLVSMKGSLMNNKLNQVAGIIGIVDLKNLSLKQVFCISKYLLFFTQAIQKCCPCRVKKVHVINIPIIFSIVWKLLSPLISEKLQRRMVFHDSDNLETLYEYIPKSILPADLDGYLDPFTNKDWAPDIEWMQNMHHEDMKYGFISQREKAREAREAKERANNKDLSL